MTTPTANTATSAGQLRKIGTYLLALVSMLAGCATPLDARKDAEFQSNAHAHDRPVARPVRSLSSFSDSLIR